MPVTYSPEGGEFHVNTYTTNDQLWPVVTALADGGYVIVWHSWYQDGDLTGVYAQVFNADGTYRGAEFRVNTDTTDHQIYPAIAALPDGGFIITWESDEYGEGIHAQIYNANGTPRGSVIDVKVSGSGEYAPSIAVLADGGFVVSWWNSTDGSFGGIGAQAFNADGTKRGGEVLVNTTTANSQLYPRIAALADGGYVITWQSQDQDGSGIGIYAQSFNADGTRRGGEFRVNTYTTSDQKDPEVAALADGGYVIVWQSSGQDGAGHGVYAQAYNANGTLRGTEFRVNTTTALNQTRPDVTALSDGGYVITWESELQDGSGYGIYAQVYNANGTLNGGEFLVNTYTASNQLEPQVAALPGGGFVVTWASSGQEGNSSGYGIYAQAYWATAVPTQGADTINASSGANIIDALGGNDTVNGRGGDDTIDGGAGNDNLTGGPGSDTFLFRPGSGSDTITDLSGGDRVLISDYLNYESITQVGANVVVVFAPGDQITFLNTTVAAVEAAFSRPGGTTGPDRLLGTNGNDTIDGLGDSDYIDGRGGDDTIYGSEGNDEIYGDTPNALEWGNNTIYGGLGNDNIFGGWGEDEIYGEDGDDIIDGYHGHNEIYGGAGADQIHSGDGSDLIYGGADNDSIDGGDGGDFIQGDAGDDIIFGNLGDDYYLDGGAGNDEIYGGDGDDYIDSNSGNDFIDGGEGVDTLSFVATGISVTVNLAYNGPQSNGWLGSDTILNVENLEGSDEADLFTGNSAANELFGMGGNDILDGGDGNDTLTGGDGNDSLTGGAGVDTASYENAAAAVSVSLSLSGAQNTGGAGTDTLLGFENLTGSAHDDFLTGNDGVNVLTGLAGNDTLNGGRGNDSMIGGFGNDTYYAQDAGDVIVEAAGEGNDDRVLAKVSYTLAAGVAVEFLGALNAGSTDALNLTGNEFGQKIVGNNGANVLTGGGGDDDLLGNGGNDTLIGGTGNDTYRVDSMGDVIVENVGEGEDIVRASTSYTLAEGVSVETLTTNKANATTAINLTGNSFNDHIIGNAGANVLTGLGGNDRLRGEGGNDTLNGGAGKDKLTGGAGNDKFVFAAAADSAVGSPDEILDFASGDKIDLSGIDANGGLANDQAFTFIGSNAFSNAAGQLRTYQNASGTWMVEGDINGDGIADFAIAVTSGAPLVQTDFVL